MFPISKKVYGMTGVKVNDDTAVIHSFTECPVVNTDTSDIVVLWQCGSVYIPEHCGIAHWYTRVCQQSF